VSGRTILITIIAVASVFFLAITVPPLFDSPAQIASQAAGTWREIGQPPALSMRVSHGSGILYAVTYPRLGFDAEGFQLEGNKLRGGGGENDMNDAVKTITYDAGDDELTISDTAGDHRYTFSRVGPGEQP
jgi:hypothetical protein